MKFETLKKLVFEKNIFGFLRLLKPMNQLYQSAFACAANSCGLLSFLRDKPASFGEIEAFLRVPNERLDALRAWLAIGVKVGELKQKNDTYSLRGSLSKHLAKQDHSIAGALFEEVVRYHFNAIINTQHLIQTGQRYSLADQNGDLIARSSRILEPFVEEAIDLALTLDRPSDRVLEVGCGSGYYLSYLSRRNSNLKIHAIDYQAQVALSAKQYCVAMGLGHKVTVEHCDVFNFEPSGRFGLVTLHNNIYYFPKEQRPALLRQVLQFLEPGGLVLLTTSCRGGSPAVEALNLWWALSDVNGALPEKEEVIHLFKQVGFEVNEVKQLMPGESYYAFLAKKPKSDVLEKEHIVCDSLVS